jgi:hypothetical protein
LSFAPFRLAFRPLAFDFELLPFDFLSWRPRHAAAAEQMQVDVKHRLAGVAVGVEHCSVPRG